MAYGLFNMLCRLQYLAISFPFLLMLFIFSSLVLTEPGFCEELFPDQPLEIVISANRIEMPREKVASSITVIDSESIESQQRLTLSEALRGQPALDVVSTGSKGASTSVSIRGANPEHTLVIMDGIEMNNPVLPSRSFNFADLMLNEVERIEILRGPQSTLYGSDAMGGVVNIVSKKAAQPLAFAFASEAGSYDSYTEQLSAAAADENLNCTLAVLRQDAAGISAADSRLGNQEKDSYDNSSYLSRLGIAINEATELNTIFRAIDSESELDNFGGAGGDDPDRRQQNEQYFWGTSLISEFLDRSLKGSASYSFSDQSFSDNNDPDFANVELLRSRYQGRLDGVHGQLEYRLTEDLYFTGGAETQQETAESRYFSDGEFGAFESDFSERSATTNGYYLQGNLGLPANFLLNAGMRVDDHSKFGSEVTYRIAPVWRSSDSSRRLFSTAASGFKAPSLFQLYSSYGSQDLEPEKSFAFDMGIEQQILADRLTLVVTYFDQEFDDLINFDPDSFLFSNISSASTSGVETELLMKVSDAASISVGYCYLDATNDETGSALLRRAKNKLSANFRMQPFDSAELQIRTSYRGSAFDNDFTAPEAARVTLAGYITTDLLASYAIDNNLQIYGRIENLFDQNYTEISGYGTYGITAFAGIRASY